MIALSKYKVNIHVIAIANNLWLWYLCPEGATHRIFMGATIKGKRYDWMQYFDEKRVTLQKMINKGCEAFKKTESKLT